mmetsp:Transcript_56757/g.101216  ORF Transcript_56757/g.101216 Transcript_56757/m.101216 type:complete len:261 (-) Transcript_56757:506-1288(-)
MNCGEALTGEGKARNVSPDKFHRGGRGLQVGVLVNALTCLQQHALTKVQGNHFTVVLASHKPPGEEAGSTRGIEDGLPFGHWQQPLLGLCKFFVRTWEPSPGKALPPTTLVDSRDNWALKGAGAPGPLVSAIASLQHFGQRWGASRRGNSFLEALDGGQCLFQKWEPVKWGLLLHRGLPGAVHGLATGRGEVQVDTCIFVLQAAVVAHGSVQWPEAGWAAQARLHLSENFLHRRNIIGFVDWINLHNVLADVHCFLCRSS